MLYCIDCKVRITGNSDRCPLCDKHMPGAYQQNPEPKYPEYIPKVRSNRKLAKAMFISAILLIMLSAGINALTWSGSLWSVIFSAYVLYIWLMGLVTFKTRVHLGIKLVGHAISVSVLMLIMNVFISKTGTLNPVTWSVSYGMPIVFNLSASTEETGIRSKRLNRIKQHSERCIFGYVYTSSGINESTTDAVYGGHGIIAENGSILAESQRFSFDSQLVISEIDTDMIRNLRLKNAALFDGIMTDDYCIVQYDGSPLCDTVLTRRINPYPFIAEGKEELDEQCKELLDIQSSAIAKRLKHAGLKKAVLGVSGGLDSTLTLIAIVKAMDKLQYPRKNIIAITMPGFGTTDRTYDNAVALIKAFGADFREISITEACLQHFKDIGHDPSIHDAAYENAQARERTQILMDIANKEGALHVGTGDLSESALGWCTYNGDHMSMYVVNAGVTKTLIRHVVKWVGENLYKETEEILNDILSTPVSPELLPKNAEGSISQKTEDIVGPYELHDFFLYHMIQYGSSPDKIYYLARHAFRDKYDKETVKKWLTVFLKRFFSQQFKRSCSTDGPKVGSISLSPRGAWMMPSDGAADTWLETLE
jgi:NAD+ synthase (glutamine-hydrolysing)